MSKITSNIKLVYELSKNDFKSKYLGSILGIIWAFIQPAITILIFWFVFEVGFKSTPVDNVPFILWLITGIIPWFFFQDGFSMATNSVQESSFLVKKVVFNVSLLPIVKITSSLYVHIFFVGVIFLMLFLYGYPLNWYNIQFLYYSFGMIILTIGLSWISSSLVVFLKDVGQFIGMILQFGFWLTPIFWNMSMIPRQFHFILSLNPMFYIVEGYRDTFIYKKWFWDEPFSIYFWCVTLVLFFVGKIVFKKMRPHFADVM